MLRLYRDLGITLLAELEAAAKDDRIRKAKGLGAALQTKILQNLAIAQSGAGRLHLHRAAALLEHALDLLRSARPDLKRLTIAGDFRRGCKLVGNFSIVAEAPTSGEAPAAANAGGLQVLSDRPQALRRGSAVRNGIGRASDQLRALAADKGMRLEKDGLAQGPPR